MPWWLIVIIVIAGIFLVIFMLAMWCGIRLGDIEDDD